MTAAEATAFNAGIRTMRDIAARSADRIEASDPRPIVAGFAVAALRQLAEDAERMVIQPDPPTPSADR